MTPRWPKSWWWEKSMSTEKREPKKSTRPRWNTIWKLSNSSKSLITGLFLPKFSPTMKNISEKSKVQKPIENFCKWKNREQFLMKSLQRTTFNQKKPCYPKTLLHTALRRRMTSNLFPQSCPQSSSMYQLEAPLGQRPQKTTISSATHFRWRFTKNSWNSKSTSARKKASWKLSRSSAKIAFSDWESSRWVLVPSNSRHLL